MRGLSILFLLLIAAAVLAVSCGSGVAPKREEATSATPPPAPVSIRQEPSSEERDELPPSTENASEVDDSLWQGLRPPVPPNKPEFQHSVKFAMWDLAQGKWVLDTLPQAEEYSLGRPEEKGIWIFYGVKSSTKRSGALSVKVIRLFQAPDSELLTATLLHRGEQFVEPGLISCQGKEQKEDFRVTRASYVGYHKDGQVHAFLENEFHANWNCDKNSFTSASVERRRIFEFPDDLGADTVQRSYLLHYETTPAGSWIPFHVGVGSRDLNQLQKIHIVISDLAAEQVGSAEIARIINAN